MASVGNQDRLVESALMRLDAIKDPCSAATGMPLGLVEMGLIKRLDIDPDGAATVELRLTAPFCHMIAFFHREITEGMLTLSGITDVTVSTDDGLDWHSGLMSPAARAARAKIWRSLQSTPPDDTADMPAGDVIT